MKGNFHKLVLVIQNNLQALIFGRSLPWQICSFVAQTCVDELWQASGIGVRPVP